MLRASVLPSAIRRCDADRSAMRHVPRLRLPALGLPAAGRCRRRARRSRRPRPVTCRAGRCRRFDPSSRAAPLATSVDGVSARRPAHPRRAGRGADDARLPARRRPSIPERLVVVTELDAKLVAALGLRGASRRDPAGGPRRRSRADVVRRHGDGRARARTADQPPSGRGVPGARAAPSPRPAPRLRISLVRALAVTPAQKADMLRLARARSPIPQLTLAQQTRARARAALRRLPVRVGRHRPERVQELYTGIAPGGFDCSGLVWRVYKLQPFPDLPLLGASIKGRTTFSMAPSVRRRTGCRSPPHSPATCSSSARAARRRRRRTSATWGSRSRRAGSSTRRGNGVTLQPLRGWYATRFAWARSPIREAGLT